MHHRPGIDFRRPFWIGRLRDDPARHPGCPPRSYRAYFVICDFSILQINRHGDRIGDFAPQDRPGSRRRVRQRIGRVQRDVIRHADQSRKRLAGVQVDLRRPSAQGSSPATGHANQIGDTKHRVIGLTFVIV